MDISETYIKMRLAAIPDLGLGVPVLNATFIVNQYIVVDTKGDFYTHANRAPYWCQLERQDQLQEMVSTKRPLDIGGDYSHWLDDLLNAFEYWRKSYSMGNDTSMDQLWLAFVQKELHNKVWDGKGWL